MKSESEPKCKEAFDAFLAQRNPHLPRGWEDVPQAQEPPDYYLGYGDSRFAVEVTRLMAKLPVSAGNIPTAGILASLDSFVDQVETAAKQQGILRGMYCLDFSRHVPDLTAVQHEVCRQILEFISTASGTDASRQDVVVKGHRVCSILRMERPSNKLVRGGPFIVKWEGEIHTELLAMIHERIREKAKRLRDVNPPKILLLDDRYLFASLTDVVRLRYHIENTGAFHTIAVIQETACLVVHTMNRDWKDEAMPTSGSTGSPINPAPGEPYRWLQ
jgi:hypothetical protein